MKNTFIRLLCVFMISVFSVLLCGSACAQKLLVTADLSMNELGKSLYKFPDGYGAFLKLRGYDPIRVRLYNTSIHLGTGLVSDGNPLLIRLQYNIDLEYDEDEADGIPFLNKNRKVRVMALRKAVAENKGVDFKSLLPFELPKDYDVLEGFLVWGAPTYGRCLNICDCSLSLQTVRTSDIASLPWR